MSIEKTAKDLIEALKGKPVPSPYDTSATVVRVDDDTLWVHIPGGVEETPVRKTVGASSGDEIQIRVVGGQAFAVGNASAPPTDDARANFAAGVAAEALDNADAAINSAMIAEASAASAVASANSAANAASSAQTSANNASQAANTALTQLSTVEDVVGTLNWISEHGTYVATTDTEVVSGKLYFTRSGSGTEADPYTYSVVIIPSGEAASATDPNGDGNVVLANVVVTDDNGNLYLRVDATASNGNVEITSDPISNPINPSASGYYELDSVDEAVSNYVSSHLALTDDGLYVINDSNGWRVLIKNDGVYIVNDNGVVVAQYKSTVTIGKETESHLNLDYHSMQLIDKEGNVYFYVSDLRDETGYVELENSYIASGTSSFYSVDAAIDSVISISVDGSILPSSEYTYTVGGYVITFATAPAEGSEVVVVYKTNSREAKAYTFGLRGTGSIGLLSAAFGKNTIASNGMSFAQGDGTTASGESSHAEGAYTRASSQFSHAEGHTTVASGGDSHAEGNSTVASGGSSHAEGWGTKASGTAQHASGKYNIEDTNNTYAEIIGNGTADNARSNARTLDWNGNEWLAGGLTINGSTDVGAILTALTADSGWISLNPLSYRKVGTIVYITSHSLSTAVSSIPATTWTTVCTLPSGYRPSQRIDAAASLGYNADVPGAIRIDTGGVVEVWASAAVASPYITFSTSYPV